MAAFEISGSYVITSKFRHLWMLKLESIKSHEKSLDFHILVLCLSCPFIKNQELVVRDLLRL